MLTLLTSCLCQRTKKHQNQQCMSTYSFTVPETDHVKCSHHAGTQSQQQHAGRLAASAGDAAVTRRLLAAVHKLVQHGSRLEAARTAQDEVRALRDALRQQDGDVQQLVGRVTELQNQVRPALLAILFVAWSLEKTLNFFLSTTRGTPMMTVQ